MAFNAEAWATARQRRLNTPKPKKPVLAPTLTPALGNIERTPTAPIKFGLSTPSTTSLPGTQTANSSKAVIGKNDAPLGKGVLGGASMLGNLGKEIAQGTARTVGTVAITAGNVPFQITGRKAPFESEIDPRSSKISNAVFGDTTIKDLPTYGKAGSKFIKDTTGLDLGESKLATLPLAGLGVAIDLSGMGGTKGIIKKIAQTTEQKTVYDIFSKAVPHFDTIDPSLRNAIVDRATKSTNEADAEYLLKLAQKEAKKTSPRVYTESNIPTPKADEQVVRFVRTGDDATSPQWVDTNLARPHQYDGTVEYGVVKKSDVATTGNPLKDADGYRLIPGSIADEVVDRNIAIPTTKTKTEAVQALPELNTPDGVKTLESRGRGVVTHEQGRANAQKLVLDEEKLLNQPVGRAYSDTELFAIRGISQQADETLRAMEDAFRSLPEGSAAAQQQAEAITLQRIKAFKLKTLVVGASTEAGRALSSLRATVNSIDSYERKIAKLFNNPKTPQAVKDYITKTIASFKGTPNEYAKLLRDVQKPTVMEMAVEFSTAIKLTSIPTHIVNAVTSSAMAIIRPFERTISAAINAVESTVRGVPRERFVADAMNDVIGQTAGWKNSWRDALTAIKNEDYAWEAQTLSDVSLSGPKIKGHATLPDWANNILNPVGKAVRLPFRLLGAMDMLLRGPSKQGALYTELGREAIAKGYTVGSRPYADYIAHSLVNPTPDLLEKAAKAADRTLFQDELPTGAAKLQRLINDHAPVVKFVVPFFKTIINLQKRALEYGPLAPLLPSVRADLKAGAGVRADALARMTVGSAVITPLVFEAMDGNITLEAPKNPAERDAFFAEGKQAYSIRIGDQWVPFSRLSPFSEWFVTAGLFAKAIKNEDDQQMTAMATNTMFSLAANVLDKSFASGMSDLLNAITGSEKERQNWLNNFIVGSTLPAISGNLARTNDPIMREVNSLSDAYKARIPFLSETLPARNDAFGKPISRQGSAIQRAILPVIPSPVQEDIVRGELKDLGLDMGFPSKSVGAFAMTDEQYYDYQRIAGAATYGAMYKVITNPAYQKLPAQDREKAMSKIISEVRERVRTQVAAEQILQKEIQDRLEKQGYSSEEAAVKAVEVYDILKNKQPQGGSK